MLTCITRSKQKEEKPLGSTGGSASTDKGASECSSNDHQEGGGKSLSSQLKEMALRASGTYINCSQCAGPIANPNSLADSKAEPERSKWASLRRSGSSNSASTRAGWGKELEARLKGISSFSGENSFSGSGRRIDPPIVLVEETLPKEWVALVEPGVLITFVSMPQGGNDLKRIRFSRDMFNKWRAQRWWAENYDRVMELYNVQRLNRQTFPLPATISEDENLKTESIDNSPVTPSMARERLPRSVHRPTGLLMGYSSSDSVDHQPPQSRNYSESTCFSSTPKLSSISGAKTETSSIDSSIRSSSSRDAERSEELSVCNAGERDDEWVEQDEPGVYITIRAMPNGRRELRRVRFSREKFGEIHARLWWEENRARVHEQYL